MADPYRAFDPRAYLRQYYASRDLSADEVAIVDRLSTWLKRRGRSFESAIDVGCGPTVHHALSIAPFVRELHLADYLPQNLAEVRRWLDADPDAHDWTPLLRGVLRAERAPADELDVRTAELRRKATALKHCDLRRDDPPGDGMRYDLVASFFCAECVAADRRDWDTVMSRLLGLVRPGGAVFLAAVRNCDRYAVAGLWFDVARVNEADFAWALERHGFGAVDVEAVAVPDWADERFDSICVACAVKPS